MNLNSGRDFPERRTESSPGPRPEPAVPGQARGCRRDRFGNGHEKAGTLGVSDGDGLICGPFWVKLH